MTKEQIAEELNAGLKRLREVGASAEERIAWARPLAAAYGRAWAYEDIAKRLGGALGKMSPESLGILVRALDWGKK